ncbi:putative transcriptional regulator [Pustulibacterium marinum]|uniref:Putative transcriptional regulator n=1 Tax=Pustulibacterium marinum TaxID=1224947 RepID=A0A1I7HZS8_9FLAO|nr:YqgE/AlgH family protein [Pustulibacterium marinum]SFU66131.1 putative transcriptional regulator [Pustulibacterium marinum]
MVALKPEKGLLLVAEPSIIGDVSFNRSVVLLAEHGTLGSVGFILNKPLDFKLSEIIPEIEDDRFKVYNGGPVEQENLYFIHRIPQLIPNSIEIASGIYWGGDFESIIDLIAKGAVQISDIKFFLGYSGWAANQLNDELSASSWVVSKNNLHSSLIKKSSKNLWKEKIEELGGDYLLWSNAPEDPTFN